jgi:type I restriction enzyme, S subunit
MNPARLLSHFDHIIDSPDAIPSIRGFILNLAVRGRLVRQDSNDQPASQLLEQIQANKERLVRNREIGKEKPLRPIEDGEVPFGVPSGWQWVRLKSITSYIQRGKSPKYAVNDGLPVVSQKCVQWKGLDLKAAKRVTRESLDTYEETRFLRAGDLLWNSTGTGTIGRIIRVAEPQGRLVCDSHVTIVRCLEVDPEYVRTWLRSDHVYGSIEERAAGATNQVELTAQMAFNQIVPLPPLAEQGRIVGKVDELMVLCDRLQEQLAAAQAQSHLLLESTLHQALTATVSTH